ncbi:hypothetical protein STRIP9103_01068 [Streptomyces ipomoeae 91-03]|uniref:Uncharacterized protein n=1 Tax=Streptomyces ipomoeae 91-03 TaxID=698759 RepID=L1KV65_9ACTN|nr:hypothetical protein STRIP9103_01068 [Streptomyces ipomoeae 91-03]
MSAVPSRNWRVCSPGSAGLATGTYTVSSAMSRMGMSGKWRRLCSYCTTVSARVSYGLPVPVQVSFSQPSAWKRTRVRWVSQPGQRVGSVLRPPQRAHHWRTCSGRWSSGEGGGHQLLLPARMSSNQVRSRAVSCSARPGARVKASARAHR